MIELKVNKGHVESRIDGVLIDLIVEMSLGFGSVLGEILEDVPKKRHSWFIGTTFESILRVLKERRCIEV